MDLREGEKGVLRHDVLWGVLAGVVTGDIEDPEAGTRLEHDGLVRGPTEEEVTGKGCDFEGHGGNSNNERVLGSPALAA